MSEVAAGTHFFDTVLHADAVEFCPILPWRDRAICGTYQLVESDEGGKAEQQERMGRLWVMCVGEDPGEKGVRARAESSLDVPGVFDIKWSGGATAETCTLGHAAADGALYTYSLGAREDSDDAPLRLHRESKLQCGTKPGALALSLDWDDKYEHQGLAGSTSRASGGGRRVAVSLSDGMLCVADHRPDGSLEMSRQWEAHDMEAWIASWDCHDRETLYSGADDGVLKRWDMRSPEVPTWVDRRSHQAGVCCIQSHPFVEHCLVTGSYDETVRLYDTRQTRAPVSELAVGGGVWRLKWNPVHNGLLAAAVMHEGFAVLRYDHASASFRQGGGALRRYKGGHDSLGYGIDWQYPLEGEDAEDGVGKEGVVGSASFYDHRFEVWDAEGAKEDPDEG